MRDFPLLDVESLWFDAATLLEELLTLSQELFFESAGTWDDMCTLHHRAQAAYDALGLALPPGIVEDIAKDRADLEEMADSADAASY